MPSWGAKESGEGQACALLAPQTRPHAVSLSQIIKEEEEQRSEQADTDAALAAVLALNATGEEEGDQGEATPLDPVAYMQGMGISKEWADAAFLRCKGVEEAVEFCFSHDMEALVLADKREGEAKEPEQQKGSEDEDRSLALALQLQDEEEQRLRKEQHATRTYGGEGSKVGLGGAFRVGSIPQAEQKQRWGADDVAEDEEEGGGEEEAEGDEREKLMVVKGSRRSRAADLFLDSNGKVISKHDRELCGRSNALRLSAFEGVGDLSRDGEDVVLSNYATNRLKQSFRSKTVKGVAAHGRIEKAVKSTQSGVLDQATRLLLNKMVTNGSLSQVQGLCKTGKEAHVFHARRPLEPASPDKAPRFEEGGEEECESVAVKIFKTTLNEFSNRGDYVDEDARYTGVKYSKQHRRNSFKMWADKEHRNLIRVYRERIPCPEPLALREHVLVMSFLGEAGWPSPQLREVSLSAEGWERAYVECLELARAMLLRCRLVHADLSEYNILYHKQACHVIDVGQAVDTSHPGSMKMLERDLANLRSFFDRKGVRCLPKEVEFAFVTQFKGPRNKLEVMVLQAKAEAEAEAAVAAAAGTAVSAAAAGDEQGQSEEEEGGGSSDGKEAAGSDAEEAAETSGSPRCGACCGGVGSRQTPNLCTGPEALALLLEANRGGGIACVKGSEQQQVVMKDGEAGERLQSPPPPPSSSEGEGPGPEPSVSTSWEGLMAGLGVVMGLSGQGGPGGAHDELQMDPGGGGVVLSIGAKERERLSEAERVLW